METPIKEKWYGNKDLVAELIDFKVLKFAAAGLLDSGKADVICLYKKIQAVNPCYLAIF